MKQTEKYEVSLSAADRGKVDYDFECGDRFFKELGNPDVLGGDVKVHVELERKSGGAVEGIMTCRGTIETACDRCLDKLIWPVNERYPFAIVEREDVAPDETGDDEGIVAVTPGATTADLTGAIADTIVLSLPLRKVHAEGECNLDMDLLLNNHEPHGPVGSDNPFSVLRGSDNDKQ